MAGRAARGSGGAIASLESGRGIGGARLVCASHARTEERWLDAYASVEDDDFELDRVAVLVRLKGRWLVAQIVIDGEECAHGMPGHCEYGSAWAARKALADAR